MRRVVIVANKWWEADPLVGVLSSGRCTPANRFVRDRETPGCRGWLEGARGRIEVWCIQELMSPDVSGSSTVEKARVLPSLLDSPDIVLVVAFGTAATPTEESHNGSVVIGTNVFIHDPDQPDKKSYWKPEHPDTVLTSPLDPRRFGDLTGAAGYADRVAARLLPTPRNPGLIRELATDHEFVALCSINVTDYTYYKTGDQKVVDAYTAGKNPAPVGSLETTHGVIRSFTKAPFLFVSGITDRVGHFDDEVKPAEYAQNFVAAHNAGVAVALALPTFFAFLAAS